MWDVALTGIIRVRQKFSILLLSGHHGCGVLISDGVLCGLHFLVFNEFVMPLLSIDISIIPAVIR